MKVNEFFDMIGWPSSELEDTEIGFWMLSDENNEEYFQNNVILYPEYNHLGCNTYKDLDIVAAPPAWEIV